MNISLSSFFLDYIKNGTLGLKNRKVKNHDYLILPKKFNDLFLLFFLGNLKSLYIIIMSVIR